MMRKQREIDMTNDEMKQYTLGNMSGMLEQLRQKVNILNALDRDTTTSGSYDLHDQLTSMVQAMDKFDTAVMNGVKVVPNKKS
jgi:beta-galactosidase beta subunit